jgi:MFS family permease
MTTIATTELYELQPQDHKSIRLSTSNSTPDDLIHTQTRLSSHHQHSLPDLPPQPMLPKPSNLQAFLVVFQLCSINFLASFTSGVITVGLPTIAKSIDLPRKLYLWPSSVYGLTSGAMLLIAGSVADQIGARIVEVTGVTLLGVLTLACGFAQTGVQLVVFRAFQGVAVAMHLPASVALVAAAVEQGKGRNLSFGCLGLSQPLGFSFGLVISGVMIERVGWRSGFYLSGAATLLATVAGVWALPKPPPAASVQGSVLHRLRTGVDWVGGFIASTGLALLAYVLAVLSADLASIHSASTAIMLTLSLLLLLAFPLWMARRERRGLPALIPNSLWRKIPFTSTCAMVALSYGVMNSMELFSSLYFQEIQDASTLSTSLRLLPNLLVGCAINLSMGFFVHRLPARWLVAVSSILCSGSSLMMALVNPRWSYWYVEFWAQVLAPMSGDVLFTVGLLIVSDEFPSETQALAGAVFNTVAQFGMSLGVGVCQVVSLGVGKSTGESGQQGEADDATTLKGFQASFWTMFALMLTVGVIAVGGLRTAGKVGVKRD